LPDGDKNSPPAAVCMGTNAALGAVVGTAVAAGALADDAAAADVAAADVAAADVAALGAVPTADDELALQADSASPTPRPSAQLPTILAARTKYREFMGITLLSGRASARCLTHWSAPRATGGRLPSRPDDARGDQ
jgi:hypothetical protein